MIKLFEEGWNLHAERKFRDAIEVFHQVLKLDPDDGPAKTYIEICKNYLNNPPPDSWQGEWIQTSK